MVYLEIYTCHYVVMTRWGSSCSVMDLHCSLYKAIVDTLMDLRTSVMDLHCSLYKAIVDTLMDLRTYCPTLSLLHNDRYIFPNTPQVPVDQTRST